MDRAELMCKCNGNVFLGLFRAAAFRIKIAILYFLPCQFQELSTPPHICTEKNEGHFVGNFK